MELLKRSFLALILLVVVAVVWVGISIYIESQSVDINPNASSYTKQLSKTFDTTELEKIDEKTKESFPIQPKEFLSLLGEN